MESILGKYRIAKIQQDRRQLEAADILIQVKDFLKTHVLTENQIAVFTGDPDTKKIITLLALLEPLMLVVMASIVLVIVIAVMLPIVNMNNMI